MAHADSDTLIRFTFKFMVRPKKSMTVSITPWNGRENQQGGGGSSQARVEFRGGGGRVMTLNLVTMALCSLK